MFQIKIWFKKVRTKNIAHTLRVQTSFCANFIVHKHPNINAKKGYKIFVIKTTKERPNRCYGGGAANEFVSMKKLLMRLSNLDSRNK